MLKNRGFFILSFFFLLFLISCKSSFDKVELVNPFIGTGGHGHTFPGSTTPFGMVQLSPDTRIEGWDGCSGYHYSDSVIYGFSHTHLSGTGVGDYCDLLLMPSNGKVMFNNGYNTSTEGYCSNFNKNNEYAKPGIYKVLLEKDSIAVALTTTDRVGIHKYQFSKFDTANVIIDLEHRDPLLDWSLKQVSSTEIIGHRISRSWAQNQHFYFYLQTSNDIDIVECYSSEIKDSTKLALRFIDLKDGELMVKVGISAVSIEGAKENLLSEANHWDFNKYKYQAQLKWERALSKMDVSDANQDKKTIFYTALYHSMIAPNIFNDVNGDYRGTDFKVHHSKENTYTIFSLWDTFRATHPLYTLIEQEKTKAFISTFLKNYMDGGQLPIWELSANYTGCMIGYHVVSVIYDAIVKGIEIQNKDQLMDAMLAVSTRDELGIPEYITHGYIPAEMETESVSKTLEYAYNDWCIAMLAQKMNKSDVYKNYISRSQNYKNCFNPSSGFMQSKVNGSWQYGFVASEVNFNFTEANSWQYSMFVPQDISGLIELHGGKENFEHKLDELFQTSSELSGRHQSDITGLIGQYAHGNEPSHHMAYLYNYIHKPFKTQQRVAQIVNEQYSSNPDGLSGNEDCGQMSSWYVLSALGFYPVTPGLPYYTIGTPSFDKVAINLENGNQFTIIANRTNSDDIYIQNVFLNQKQYDKSYLNHNDIISGGELIFELGPSPSEWGKENIPISKIDTLNRIVCVPYFTANQQSFKDSILIELISNDTDAEIFIKSKADSVFNIYNHPFYIKSSATFSAYCVLGEKKSKMVSANYFKYEGARTLQLNASYSNQYNAGGDNALIDGLKGPDNFMTGYWQGYHNQQFEAIVDLGEKKQLHSISIGALQDIKSWIWFPKNIEFLTSNDNVNYSRLSIVKNNFPDDKYGCFIQDFSCPIPIKTSARYIKIIAKNYGKCPSWHLGKGGDTWLFFDEVTVN